MNECERPGDERVIAAVDLKAVVARVGHDDSTMSVHQD